MITFKGCREIINGDGKSKKSRLLAIIIGLFACYIVGSLIGIYVLAGYSTSILFNLMHEWLLLAIFGHIIWLLATAGGSLLLGEVPAFIYIFFGRKWLYFTAMISMLMKCIFVVITMGYMTT